MPRSPSRRRLARSPPVTQRDAVGGVTDSEPGTPDPTPATERERSERSQYNALKMDYGCIMCIRQFFI